MTVRPVKTLIRLGRCPVWSESSLCTEWVAKDPRFLHADSEDSDQTGRMPRLIWVFAGRTRILLVLSCCGSHGFFVAPYVNINRPYVSNTCYKCSCLLFSVCSWLEWTSYTSLWLFWEENAGQFYIFFNEPLGYVFVSSAEMQFSSPTWVAEESCIWPSYWLSNQIHFSPFITLPIITRFWL